MLVKEKASLGNMVSKMWHRNFFIYSPHRNINLNNYLCTKIPSQELMIPGPHFTPMPAVSSGPRKLG